jgi:hypothetical protein
MSKLFINTFVQQGGNLSDSDAVVILNTISKHINKKMKILEYKYGIDLKLERLPEDNWDSIPKKIGIQTIAQIDGPLKGQLPVYTNVDFQIPTPTISTVTTGVPVTPFGPVIGVPTIAINPFGNPNSLEDRNKKALKYLEIIKSIESQLEKLKNGLIEKKDVDTTYFTFVDLEEPDTLASLEDMIGKVSGYYSSL